MRVIAWLLLSAALIFGYVKFAHYAADNDLNGGRFTAVCEYSFDGNAQGDLCIKDRNVVLTKDEFLDKENR